MIKWIKKNILGIKSPSEECNKLLKGETTYIEYFRADDLFEALNFFKFEENENEIIYIKDLIPIYDNIADEIRITIYKKAMILNMSI